MTRQEWISEGDEHTLRADRLFNEPHTDYEMVRYHQAQARLCYMRASLLPEPGDRVRELVRTQIEEGIKAGVLAKHYETEEAGTCMGDPDIAGEDN